MHNVSINQLAELTGKTRRTVKKKLENLNGKPGPNNSTVYDSTIALAAIYDVEASTHTTAQVERARLDRLRADKVEIDIAVARGELIHADAAVGALEKVLMRFRAKILAMPTKSAPVIFGCKSLAQVKAALEKQLSEALDELSGFSIAGTKVTGGAKESRAAAIVDSKPVGRPRTKVKSRK